MFLGRLMRSAMVLISLKAFSMARSELLMVRRFWYFELPNSSKLAAPVPWGGNVRCFYSLKRTLWGDDINRLWPLIGADTQLSLTLPIMVVRSPPLSRGFWASPTRDGSLRAFSLENVLHSEPTSMTRSPEERWLIEGWHFIHLQE